MDYSRKKQTGWGRGRGVKNMKFPGVLKKEHVEFESSIKKSYTYEKGGANLRISFWQTVEVCQ